MGWIPAGEVRDLRGNSADPAPRPRVTADNAQDNAARYRQLVCTHGAGSMERRLWGYLVPFSGDRPPLELRGVEVTVGRDAGCHVVLQDIQLGCKPDTISKKHFRLVHGPQGTLLKDDSRAGTYVNSMLVGRGKQVHLPHGARICVVRPSIKAFIYVDKATSDTSNHAKYIKDKYVFVHQLGEGGFGQVFLVLDKINHQRYAMKIVKNTNIARREAEILQELDHPCTIHTYHIFSNSERLYLVLEYMGGGDLSHWVNDKKLLSEKQIKLLFYQLALAVQYLHQNAITHRDLKPANILMVTNMPRTLIKVTDFGLAKDEDLHSNMTTCAGTEVYLAPEVMTSKSYTKKVDVWSMGVILFFSLSGTLPFNSMTEAMRMHHLVMFSADRWHGVSVSALELVRRMLVVVPDRRIGISEVLATSWLQDQLIKDDAHSLMGQQATPTTAQQVDRKTPTPVPSSRPAATPSPAPKANLKVPTPSPNPVPSYNRQAVSPRGVLQYLGSGSARGKPVQVQQPQAAIGLKQKMRDVRPVRMAAAAVHPPAVHSPAVANNYNRLDPIPATPAKRENSPAVPTPYRPGQFGIAAAIKPPVVHKAQKTFLLEARHNLKPVPWKP